LPAQRERLQQQQRRDVDEPDEPDSGQNVTLPAGPVLEDGVRTLIDLLRQFPGTSQVASEVCCALARIASVNSAAILPVLSDCQAGDTLLAVAAYFTEDTQVLRDAAVALGVLGGAGRVLSLMQAAPNMYAVQLAGCCALAEMRRMGFEFPNTSEQQAAVEVVQRVRDTFASQTHLQLLAQAELTLGLIQQVPSDVNH